MNRRNLTGMQGTFLVCPDGDDGEFSSNPSDYWWMSPQSDLTCETCGAFLVEVLRESRLVEVSPT